MSELLPNMDLTEEKDNSFGYSWCLSGQIDPNSPVRRVIINTSPFIVGRRSDSGICLTTSSVSKQHASLEQRGESLWLCDLGSTNGTYINGEKVASCVELNDGDLVQFATVVFRVSSGRNSVSENTMEENACDRALALMQFERLINDGGLLPYFQPIIGMADKSIVGFEILGRSRLFGLKSPAEMFAAASELNMENKLSESFREKGIEETNPISCDLNIFLNTHPCELGTPDLFTSLHSLRELCPDQKITLEIHEAAVTNSKMINELRNVLKDLDMNLAFDDFGEGRARLVELSEAKPDCVKFDMKLTKDICKAPVQRQEIVATIAKLVKELGITVLAEGVETEADHLMLVEMGFDLGQGFHYGRPARLSNYLPTLESQGLS